MRNVIILAALLVVVAGCPSTDELFLTPSEAEALQDNFEAAVDAEQRIAEFVFAASRGDLDLEEYAGATYVEPTEGNGWVGSLTIPGGVFPFGTGDLSVDFTTLANGLPVDPYDLDLSEVAQLDIDADVVFDGLTTLGADLGAIADISMSTVQNGEDFVTTMIDGAIEVTHDGYVVDLDLDDVQLQLDLEAEDVVDVLGSIEGSVDIPDLIYNADFELEGLGSQVEIAIDVVATKLRYTLSIFDF